MVRVWGLFFVLAFSVAFLIHRPTGMVEIPHGIEYKQIPADVFWYHLNEHLIMIIISLIMLSFFRWPSENGLYWAYALFFVIQIVDVILYRLFYRNWPIEAVPWNFCKVAAYGTLTVYLQIRTIWKSLHQ